MAKNLGEFAKKNGIKYFMVTFTDLFGSQRAKIVPARIIDDVAEGGAGFAGFATWLDLTAAHPDMLAVPDTDAVIQLPWRPEVAWVPANCVMSGKPLDQAPRNVLRQLIDEAAKDGLNMKTGVEPEFFLLTPEGDRVADPHDTAVKPCYDQQAIMRRYDVISEVSDYMLEMGWEPYQSDHEDAIGQFEMNWNFDDALVSSDKLSFFKFMMKSVAEKHGLRATFMPKPFPTLTGSGMHVHLSIWSPDGTQNLFVDKSKELGLSELGRNFLGGLMEHASALAAITNPTVNSYKRINAPRTISGSTWAPNSVTWTGDNRTHMVRVLPGRIEHRLPDGAANPYLMHAVILAAGLDGVRRKLDPGSRSDIDMYTDGHLITDAPKLPLNLLDALRAFEADTVLCDLMGPGFAKAFVRQKRREWDSFVSHFSRWERENTLDV